MQNEFESWLSRHFATFACEINKVGHTYVVYNNVRVTDFVAEQTRTRPHRLRQAMVRSVLLTHSDKRQCWIGMTVIHVPGAVACCESMLGSNSSETLKHGMQWAFAASAMCWTLFGT